MKENKINGNNENKIKQNKFNQNKENMNNKSKNNENNYIIAEINIKENEMNKDIRIINSYEECLRTKPDYWSEDGNYKNEDEIKNCEIRINDELIPFNYFNKFKSKGIYTIKYTFKNKLKSTHLMFQGCSSLNEINLSHFNTNNIIDMGHMFQGCSSLTNINLSLFNTKHVTNL